MHSNDDLTPVVVLGCFRQGGIGIIRSLGRLGVPVYAVDGSTYAPAFFSKYCRGKYLWDINRAPADETLAFLLRIGHAIGRRSVLIPTSDIGAMFVAEQAAGLAEYYIFPGVRPALVRSLCSKKEMYYIARSSNVPTPETAFPKSRDDVIAYLETSRFPIMVKPIYSGQRSSKIKAWRKFLAETPGELIDRYDQIEDSLAPNVMLQEYIPGTDSMTWVFNGYFDRSGECLVAFTGRKLRNYPPYFGQASLAICQENSEVAKISVNFMKSIGYTGPLDMGFRQDIRDGQYKVHDVNPRIGSMFRTFVGDNGIDVSRALYQDLTDQPVVGGTAREGRRWLVEDVDWISALRYWRDGNLSIKDWLRSLSGIKETAFLCRDDPWPFLGACMLDARSALAAGLGALKRTPKPNLVATGALSD